MNHKMRYGTNSKFRENPARDTPLRGFIFKNLIKFQ